MCFTLLNFAMVLLMSLNLSSAGATSSGSVILKSGAFDVLQKITVKNKTVLSNLCFELNVYYIIR